VAHNKTLRLLVVEDSFEDERFLRELLEEAAETRVWPRSIEWETVFAATAEEACNLAIDGGFDAILLNLSLPDSRVLHETFMSVFGVARSTPILVIADEPDSSLETLLLREGAQDFLLKSELDAEPLARRMKHAVERQRYVNSFSMARLADAVAAPRQIALDTVPLDLIVVAEATLVE
jgi:DNA-binding NarL/FixJ family response regulator